MTLSRCAIDAAAAIEVCFYQVCIKGRNVFVVQAPACVLMNSLAEACTTNSQLQSGRKEEANRKIFSSDHTEDFTAAGIWCKNERYG